MSSEFLFFALLFLSISFVALASTIGRDWLILCIPLFLIFTNIVSSKLIVIFGTVTTIGNASFVAIYLASDLLCEKGLRREARSTIRGSFAVLFIFYALGTFATFIPSLPSTSEYSNAVETVFHGSWRIIAASGFAYLLSASLNFWSYSWMREHAASPRMSSLVAAVIAYILDQIIFVSIAFLGAITQDVFFELLLSGIILKLLFALIESLAFDLVRKY